MPALKVGFAFVASGLVACGAHDAESRAALLVDPTDAQERARVEAASPAAAELLSRGEDAFARGDVRGAAALFADGTHAYGDGGLLWRRRCEAQTVLGAKTDAVASCAEAIERRRSGAAVRAMVTALVEGPTAPAPAALVEALMVTAKERANPLGAESAAAAACDVAEKIGDLAMTERCAGELERLSPEDPPARKARAFLRAKCTPWRFWGGWLAIASLLVLTLADVVRRRRRIAAGAIAVASAACIVLSSPTARAEGAPAARATLSRWPVDAEHPELNIPSEKDRNAEPLEFGYWLQDVATRADHASKSGDHAAAARYYGALAAAVPDRAVGYVKMCQELEAAGDLQRAVDACGNALLRDGTTVADYSRFVGLVLSKPGALSAKEVGALDQVVVHMREDPAGRDVVDDLECRIATRTGNVAQLEECTSVLASRAPDDARTIAYQWALAVQEGRMEDAEMLDARAGAAGIAPESLATMRKVVHDWQRARAWRIGLGVTAIALLLAAAIVAGAATMRKRVTPAPAPSA